MASVAERCHIYEAPRRPFDQQRSNGEAQRNSRKHEDGRNSTGLGLGLCALFGIAFMPRLKDLPDQVLSRIDRHAD